MTTEPTTHPTITHPTITHPTTTHPTVSDPQVGDLTIGVPAVADQVFGLPTVGDLTFSESASGNGSGPGHGSAGGAGHDGPVLTRPLGDFLPSGPAADRLTVTLPDGRDVVVIGRTDDGQVEVWSASLVLDRSPDTLVSAVTDPVRRDGLLASVVHRLAQHRDAAEQRATRLAADRSQDHEAHRNRLTAIRAYAVEKHQSGDICRTGLNEFLETFGLGRFEPRIRVHFTVSGSYDVDGDDSDVDAAWRDGQDYLKPDLSELDHVIEGSGTFTVSLDSLEDLES